jgi:hypothetical protein
MRLMALHLMQSGDRRRERVATALRAMLEDYANSMPSGQRLFLMEEMQALGLGTFATLEAERLAARYLETGAPELWKLRSPGGTVALFHAATLAAQMREAAAAQGVEVTPPGVAPSHGPDAQTVAAGAASAGDSPVHTVARYAAKGLLLSGFLQGEQLIAGRSAVVETRAGAGRIVMIGFPAQYRGQSVATFRLIFNAILSAPPVPARSLPAAKRLSR